ncbi:MAG: mechanosensitive ion channel family protein [Deltaproteobacteria bacterium]|nr:mechanosensitive ion channel family protein [Deltaproteobacteria bacterium]
MELGKTWQFIVDNGVYFGMKVLGAIAIWIIGRWLIGLAVKLATAALDRQKVDTTLSRYLGTVISGTLTIILVVAILGFFGVETTSFAAIVAAAGVAIGMAWSGLLANFAAGAFMMVLRPIKVGDDITAGGVTGTVKEIGLFATTINTPDNVLTMVGNNKIFGDTIQNYTANPYRRVDLKAQLTDAADHHLAIKMLKERVAAVPNVLKDPPPDVAIMELNGTGPCLLVRPYCNNAHYWQVHADTNQVIKQTMIDGKFPGPVGEMIVHNRS